MITIDQLLESVDLNFEPRFVTKDESGDITIFSHRPTAEKWCGEWREDEGDYKVFGEFKLAEFTNKPWQECIYEVPRKTTRKVEKLGRLNVSSTNMTMNQNTVDTVVDTLNQVIDAVNELKERTEPITLNLDLTDEDLRKMMRDPRYWRDKDSATIQKVQNGFNKLYGDKN